MLSHITLMGGLTADPTLTRTQAGTSVCSFRLTCQRDRKSANEKKPATDFIDVVTWRNTAEFVSRYFSKGRMAVVDGRLQPRDWTNRDGNNRRNAEIVADSAHFGDSRPQSRQEQTAYASSAAGAARCDGHGGGDLDAGGDLPF